MSLLTCQNVSFAYEGNVILSDIDFSVNQGDYLCIVGENGAGKSTLIKGILNLKKTFSGNIITGEGLAQNEIGYLPQQTPVQKDFPASVYEVVLSGRLNSCGKKLFYSKKDKEAAIENMKKLELLSLKNQCYRELSGGQQQRVLLARALCAAKKLILLDEPITGLDPIMSMEFYNMVKELNVKEKMTVIMVSHDVKGAVDFASHILHLGKKQLFFGTKEEYCRSVIGIRFLGGTAL
ncbi:metal ABC transporter ATP-binding protein [Aminipila luticellarii]|uniref:ABC transporter ATP-binding protein n=1 Tax=Aminipila luticellarii TaxID=2507160 RepID=A0A410PVI6_9FIRM|nr:ABC transporter ATP-binding protein [Aminipila luticellarii]QAT42935.1 ABC transporter ATP-binding protein [Aminipila luticellarii]